LTRHATVIPGRPFASKSLKAPDRLSRLSGVFSFRSPHEICNSRTSHREPIERAALDRSQNAPEGKAIVAQINFRHGFTGAFRVLAWENQDDYRALHLSLEKEHQPSTATEEMLVETMAQSYWLRKRALALQNTCFSGESLTCEDEKNLALYMRYQNTHDRAFHRSLKIC
jgi:hypothetical protein